MSNPEDNNQTPEGVNGNAADGQSPENGQVLMSGEVNNQATENQNQESDETQELDYEEEAKELINNLTDTDEERARIRYGEGRFGQISQWFNREGKRQKAETLEEAGEYKQNDKWKKYARLGLKIAGGFGLAAAMTFTGLGAVPLLTPILWTYGVKKGWDGILEAGEELGWGWRRTERELETQGVLSEKINALKDEIKRRKEAGRGLTTDEFNALTQEIIEADNQVGRVAKNNFENELKWALGRNIASSVLTIGTAIFVGIPLGYRNYDHNNVSHRVYWNLDGGRFFYNPDEISKATSLAVSGKLKILGEGFGQISHTLGHGLPFLDRGMLAGTLAYLFLHHQRNKKKIEGRRYRADRGWTHLAPSEAASFRQKRAAPILTREEMLDDSETNDFRLSRRTALIILAKLKNHPQLRYADLNAENEEERKEKFIALAKEVLKREIVVHQRNREIKDKSDLDGETALYLLRLAVGGEIEVFFEEQGKFRQKHLNIDTGMRDGIAFEPTEPENGAIPETAFIDHHGPRSWTEYSAAELTYETLINLGLLQRNERLDKLIRFVTEADNMTGLFRDAAVFERSGQSVVGLYRAMKPDKIIDFFTNNEDPDPTRKLSDEELKNYGLIYKDENDEMKNESDNRKKAIPQAKKVIKEIESAGKIMLTSYGKVLIDEGGRLKISEAAFAAGYSIIINYSSKGFFVSGMPRELSLPEGIRIRNMWMRRGKPTISLRQITSIFEREVRRARPLARAA